MDLLLAFNGIPFMILMLAAGAAFFFIMKKNYGKKQDNTEDIEE